MKPPPSRVIALCGALWFVAGLLPALASFRFLYGDGAFYLLQILEKSTFFFPGGVRQSAQVLDQGLAVAAVRLGFHDIRMLAWCLGIGMLMMPVFLHGISLVILLRRGWTVQAAVYLVMLWLLTFFGGLMATSESHVATAVFLLAVVIALTHSPFSIGRWISLGLIGLISFRLYEFWFFYAAGLMVLLVWRHGSRFRSMNGGERAAGLTVLLILLGSLIINAASLLGSSGNPDRISLLQMLSGTTYPLYLVLITAWFLGLCVHVWLLSCRQDGPVWRWIPTPGTRMIGLLLSMGSLMALAVSGYQHHTMIRYSYPFRTLNLILPMSYLLWMLILIPRHERIGAFSGCRTLLVMLTFLLLVRESRLTSDWRRYQEWAGAVPRGTEKAAYVATPPDTVLARTWIYPWTQPAHSFLAQALRTGVVRGVSFDPGSDWSPYGPGNERTLKSIADACGVKWE